MDIPIISNDNIVSDLNMKTFYYSTRPLKNLKKSQHKLLRQMKSRQFLSRSGM